jgi:putative polyhydroxyalkanoate system protein
MAHIDITRTHDLGHDGAREAAEQVAHELSAKLDTGYAWHGDTIQMSKNGVKGQLETSDRSVRVVVKLPLTMRPFRGTLQREIERYLDDYLGPNGAG